MLRNKKENVRRHGVLYTTGHISRPKNNHPLCVFNATGGQIPAGIQYDPFIVFLSENKLQELEKAFHVSAILTHNTASNASFRLNFLGEL